MPSDVVPIRQGGDIIEQVITKGDLAKLTPMERVTYYKNVCDSVGLNPLTRPLAFITLNGKLVLYALRDAADQLRKINGISVEVVSQKVDGDMLTVHVRARDKTGRTDEDFGVVSIAGLRGEARANQQMKGITKAKRRVTLSIAGLGFLDETEVDDIPARERINTAAGMASDTTADLDQFAKDTADRAAEELHRFDVMTGEVEPPPPFDLFAETQAAAERGMDALEAFWAPLSPADKRRLKPHLDAYKAIAKRADEATDDDPFGFVETATAEPVTEPGQPVAARDVFAELDHEARAATKDGIKDFEAWWKTLRAGDKDLLRAFLGEYQRLAHEADAQRGLAL